VKKPGRGAKWQGEAEVVEQMLRDEDVRI